MYILMQVMDLNNIYTTITALLDGFETKKASLPNGILLVMIIIALVEATFLENILLIPTNHTII